jgi:hypothetical protein
MGAVNLFSDLDGWSWLALIATLALCGFILSVSIWSRNHDGSLDLGGIPKVLGPLGFFCLIGAFESYSSYDGVPRKTVEGSAHIVHVSHGRHSTNYYICADTCAATGGYTLQLDERAGDALSRDPRGTRYRFTYPDKPRGGALTGVSLVVESIAKADTGRVIYERDLRNHPWRIAFYLGDLALAVFAFYFWVSTTYPREPAGDGSDGDAAKPTGDEGETTPLRLE